MTNIYVGNLPYTTQEDDLIRYFSQWGAVERATLVFDRETGRPRGFGFVEMIDPDDAQQAIEEAHGGELNGRPLTVNEARPRGSGGHHGAQAPTTPRYARPNHNYGTPAESINAPAAGYRNQSPAYTPSRPVREAQEVTEVVGGGGYSNQLYS